jgi:hypothetical protein
MKQNRKRQTTNSETIREKHACPKPALKQFQGTGNNRFDSKTQKTTGPDPGKPKNRIWSLAECSATPALDQIINTLDIPRAVQGAAIINAMHERFAHFILEELAERGLPYGIFDGQTFTLRITFSNERPEER